MERIDHLEDYKTLLKENRQRIGKVQSNCMLMAGDMARYIEEGRLFYDTLEEGLIIRIDEGIRENLYYFLRPDAPFPVLERGKSLLIEELDNRGTRKAELEGLEARIFAAGFERSRVNVQVERMMSDALVSREAIEAQLYERGFMLETCTEGRVPAAVEALWRAHLNALDIPQDHLVLREGDVITNVMRKQGELAATIWWRHSGRSSECRHVVTAPNYLRRALASALVRLWMSDACSHGANRMTTWINESNMRSLALFEKHGFAQNGRVSRQYLLR